MPGSGKPISVDPAALGTTFSAAMYTVTAGMTGILHEVLLCNTDTVDRWVEIALVPSGSPAAKDKVRFGAVASSIRAGNTERWLFSTFLKQSSGIWLRAEAANVVGARISLTESDDAELLSVDPILLTSTSTTSLIATGVPAGKLHKMMELVLCNQHTAPVQVEVHAIPSGGSIGVSNKIRHTLEIPAGDTEIWPFQTHLEAGSLVQIKASVANVISVRGSFIEMVVT